jgi:hypothetical protein
MKIKIQASRQMPEAERKQLDKPHGVIDLCGPPW